MIRDPLPSDQSFVASTWVRSMLSLCESRAMGSDYGVACNAHVDGILDLPTSKVIIACWDVYPDVIFGWLSYRSDGSQIHYIWVRRSERNKGLATAMLRHVGIDKESAVSCTSNGPDSAAMRSRYKGAVHEEIPR